MKRDGETAHYADGATDEPEGTNSPFNGAVSRWRTVVFRGAWLTSL